MDATDQAGQRRVIPLPALEMTRRYGFKSWSGGAGSRLSGPVATSPEATQPEGAADAHDRGGVVVVIGRSWLSVFVSLLTLDVLSDGDITLLIGRPVEATRAVTAAMVKDGAGRVALVDQPLVPGSERFFTQPIGRRRVRLIVCASDDQAEQQVARTLAKRMSARVVGASCGGPGWVGPDVPPFSGAPDQRPAMAMRLAQVLAAEVAAALRDDRCAEERATPEGPGSDV